MKFNLQLKGLKFEAVNNEKRFGFNLDEINYSEELSVEELETVLDSCKEVISNIIEEVKETKSEETVKKDNDAEYVKQAQKLLSEIQEVEEREANYENVAFISKHKYQITSILIEAKYKNKKDIINEIEEIKKQAEEIYKAYADRWLYA